MSNAIIQVRVLDERIGKHEKLPMPEAATPGSAAMDLRACLEEDSIVLQPGEVKLIGTGLAMYIGDPSLVGLILPRSGLGHKKGIVLGNLVGVIDADYQGELKISLWNRSSEPYTVELGERIAQYAVVPVIQPTLEIVDEFSEMSTRGEGGFGSTGKG